MELSGVKCSGVCVCARGGSGERTGESALADGLLTVITGKERGRSDSREGKERP